MRLANGEVLMHDTIEVYDPVKAHEYYLRTRKLKGRKKGSASPPVATPHKSSAAQKQALTAQVAGLQKKLGELDALIAKKEKAAKEAAKPDTAAEKSKKARESRQYRDKHKTEISKKAKKAAAEEKSTSGGSSTKTSATSTKKSSSLADLKMLRTKIKGQIQTAKAKLGSL